MGVDLGSRRIGLAVSDPSGTTAFPHAVIERAGRRRDDLQAVVEAARGLGAERIVVGLPLTLAGERGPAARRVLSEVEELRRIAGEDLPVDVHDERLSTVTAERVLVEAGERRAARRAVIDKVAAAVILQSWLDSRRGA